MPPQQSMAFRPIVAAGGVRYPITLLGVVWVYRMILTMMAPSIVRCNGGQSSVWATSSTLLLVVSTPCSFSRGMLLPSEMMYRLLNRTTRIRRLDSITR